MGELPEPPAQAAIRRQGFQITESFDQRVVGQELHVAQTPAAGQPKRDEDEDVVGDAVVAAEIVSLEGLPDLIVKPDNPEVSFEKLKSGVTADLLLGELDFEISVDSIVDFVVF